MPQQPIPSNTRVNAADRAIGARIKMRRLEVGFTQHELAELIGVTYQQAYKYENAMNRVSAGRLHAIAHALGVGVGYFYQDLQGGAQFKPTPEQALLLELATHFRRIRGQRQQEAICAFVRALAAPEKGGASALDRGNALLGITPTD